MCGGVKPADHFLAIQPSAYLSIGATDRSVYLSSHLPTYAHVYPPIYLPAYLLSISIYPSIQPDLV